MPASPISTLVPTITIPPTETPFLPPTLTHTPVATATATPSPTPAVLIGAGDIAQCGDNQIWDDMTSEVLSQYPDAVIFTAGDNVQGDGRKEEYEDCFDPSWGRFKDRIRPAAGNHDFAAENGVPYYEYFGPAAGKAEEGYYSYNLGSWRLIVLNSNCVEGTCDPDSNQVQWLRQELEAYANQCTLLYWHRTYISSGMYGKYESVLHFWQSAAQLGGDIVVNGHDHIYERFAPMDASGNFDPNGVRLFIVGTGGADLQSLGEVEPNSEVRYTYVHGVLQFNLYPGWYEWKFIPVTPGSYPDAGSGDCR